MSKEDEKLTKEQKALDGLAQFIIMNDTGTDESASAIEWHGILKQALTPPTSDEVCKALSEFVGREVSYTNKQFHYIIKNTQVLMFVTETYNNKTVSLGVYLPPHFITLLGRVYEGEIK